jgi:hypothetical protein
MPEQTVVCHRCGRAAVFAGPVPRGASCDACASDLRSCLNCAHYDPGSYNDCRETSAERVVDKDKSNFCDFYRPRAAEGASDRAGGDAMTDLEKLFK